MAGVIIIVMHVNFKIWLSAQGRFCRYLQKLGEGTVFTGESFGDDSRHDD